MEMLIPKVIHYIWLGTNEIDKISLKCMDSWSKILPEYKIVRWNDEKCKNIISKNLYARQAYEKRKYAFVSDYLRLYILYNYGGVYMDTDVQVFKSIDKFLENDAFTCFENRESIPTALMAAKKGNKWIEKLLHYYDNRAFILENGQMDLKTNVSIISEMSKKWGFIPNGEEQILDIGVHIYTKDYFCPIDTKDKRKDVFTENTYAAHLYNGSWRSPLRQKLSKMKKRLGIDIEKYLPPNILKLLRKI